MFILSRSEMYECDKRTMQEFGIISQVLMENAGKSCADYIKESIELQNNSVLIICGDGNNGGDGFVIARWLTQYKFQVSILLIGDPGKMSPETLVNYKLCQKLNLTFLSYDIYDYSKYSLIIDSLYGIGFRGELTQKVKDIFSKINSTDSVRLAIDIPSGLNADTGEAVENTFNADFTLTMAHAKIGHFINQGTVFTGKLKIIDIGIPEDILLKVNPKIKYFSEADITFPTRFKNSHKGNYGRLGIVAGSKSFTGAAILASRSALSCGAGLITLYHQPGLELVFESTLIEVMTKAYDADDEDLLKNIYSNDVILIGPGLGKSESALKILTKIIDNYKKPLIIDADAINLLAENRHLLEKLKGRPVILTPHLAEFSRLTDFSIERIENYPLEILRKFCEVYQVFVLLKSHICISANIDNTNIIDGGNDGLATGGTGDVLAGMIASFLVQNIKNRNNQQVLFDSVNSAVKYLYIISEKLNKILLTPAITPGLLVENIFNKSH